MNKRFSERQHLNRKTGERGQALLMVFLTILLLFGTLGLAVDLGWAYYVHLNARTAADSAALAAAEAALAGASGSALTCGSHGVACNTQATACNSSPTNPPTTNSDNGCLYAQANGFVNSGGQSVTIQSNIGSSVPTVSGLNDAQYWVVARVSQDVPQLFSSVFGHMKLTTAAEATAAIVPKYSGSACIYTLAPTGSNSFVVSGSASLHGSCDVYVNSSDSQAVQVTGGACVSGDTIHVVGNDTGSNSCISPAVNTGYAAFTDPLAGLTEPSFPTSCDYTNASYSNVTQTLSPGVYCGGITVSGGSTITFGSGLYTLIGGGLVSSSSNSSITGTNVTFYNTACGSGLSHTTCPTGSSSYNGSYKPLVISGGSTATLSAPTSGLYNNILYMQDRTLSVQSSQETLSGGSTGNFTGVVYVPRSPMVYSGGSSTANPKVGIIAWTFTITGSSYLQGSLNGTGKGTGASAAMVE